MERERERERERGSIETLAFFTHYHWAKAPFDSCLLLFWAPLSIYLHFFFYFLPFEVKIAHFIYIYYILYQACNIFAHVKTACMVTAGMKRLSSLVLQAVTKASRQNTLVVQSLWHSRRITASHRGFRFSGSFGQQAGNV